MSGERRSGDDTRVSLAQPFGELGGTTRTARRRPHIVTRPIGREAARVRPLCGAARHVPTSAWLRAMLALPSGH